MFPAFPLQCVMCALFRAFYKAVICQLPLIIEWNHSHVSAKIFRSPVLCAMQSPGKGEVQRPMTHAISEGNLVSLDRSAGDQMASALKRLLV